MILITNDDGIDSAGLLALAEVLSSLDDVTVVAPDRERSAASHSLTLHRPLRVVERAPGWWAVDGTPTDCVNLAVHGGFAERPRLVVSGINKGANLGDDVTYSGTVSAAMEGVLLGIPSIAMSLSSGAPFAFEVAAAVALKLATAVERDGLPPKTLLNVNVPDGLGSERPELVVTRQGHRRYADAIVENVDPRGGKYYWIAGTERDEEHADGTDFAAVAAGLVSITPIHLDLTAYDAFEHVARLAVDRS